ncbi:MAG: type II secretion system protein [Planctomycetota bacterium]|nr:type II secretion system protein [Planctomycetota bacterium]
MNDEQARRTTSAGFTLLELLAVILIIGILSTVLITQLYGTQKAAYVSLTGARLKTLQIVFNQYAGEYGDVPPSSFTQEQGVPNDGENVGIEACVVALFSNGWEAGGLLQDDFRSNSDGDSSTSQLTDFGNKNLLEFEDLWNNPIAYIHHRDYGIDNRAYLTWDEADVEVRSFPKAYKDPLTGRYFRHDSFQLISAGPNGVFDDPADSEGDDIFNFDRR